MNLRPIEISCLSPIQLKQISVLREFQSKLYKTVQQLVMHIFMEIFKLHNHIQLQKTERDIVFKFDRIRVCDLKKKKKKRKETTSCKRYSLSYCHYIVWPISYRLEN